MSIWSLFQELIIISGTSLSCADRFTIHQSGASFDASSSADGQ